MAYVIEAQETQQDLPGLPSYHALKDGCVVSIELLSREATRDTEAVRAMLNYEIEHGMSFPQDRTLDAAGFAAYFLSHAAFVLKGVSRRAEEAQRRQQTMPQMELAARPMHRYGDDGPHALSYMHAHAHEEGAHPVGHHAPQTHPPAPPLFATDAAAQHLRPMALAASAAAAHHHLSGSADVGPAASGDASSPPMPHSATTVSPSAGAGAREMEDGGGGRDRTGGDSRKDPGDGKLSAASHLALVHRPVSAHAPPDADVLGAFYIKPNFPGRSSHLCNGGFLVHLEERGRGIGKVMAHEYLRLARALGYAGSFFNLVYAVNVPSLNLWRSIPGFVEVGTIPGGGKMADGFRCDAVQFYYDLESGKKGSERAATYQEISAIEAGKKRIAEMAKLPSTSPKRRKSSNRFQSDEALVDFRLSKQVEHLPTNVSALHNITQGDCRVCVLAGYRSKTSRCCSDCKEPLCQPGKKHGDVVSPCWHIWHNARNMLEAIKQHQSYFKLATRRGPEQLV